MNKVKVIFETGPLITSAKFKLEHKPILDFIIDSCEIVISSSVVKEVVVEGSRYLDSILVKERVDKKRIFVKKLSYRDDRILKMYRLGEGEIDSILLYQELKNNVDFLVIDDNLAYIVSDRLGLNKIFLVDLIVELVRRSKINKSIAKEIIEAVKTRYSEGFIEHSLEMLKEV